MRKKRVLFIGEASYLATGFSTYYNEVISRLHKTGEFELAEQGSYAKDNDPRNQKVPWKFYPVQPAPNDREGMRAFSAKRTNQFGEWRFAQVCLDWKPDIVCMVRDFWMDEFVLRSPLRDKFKVCWLPTIDGIPQKQEWLDHYKLCDKVMTYSRWGHKVLEQDGRPGTNLVTVASPGVDTDVFKPPENKREHKGKFGIDPDSIIIGTVMRNQKRKLYYDLIEAFSMWIHKTKSKGHLDLVKRTFLYLHTSYPDQGWDIGAAIKEFKVGNKVIMTYLCQSCGIAFPSFFAGDLAACRKCGKISAQPPNANNHVSRETLAGIMNMFDLYVQYSICLHPDTPIMLEDRSHKSIRDIQKGDAVICGDGVKRKVKWCTQTSKKSDTISINHYGNGESIICTPEHRMMVCQNDKPNPMFLEAKRLTKQHWLMYPIDRSVDNLDNDPDFYYLAGKYIADGGIHSVGCISFSFHLKENDQATRIERWLNRKKLTNKRLYHKKAKEFRVIVSSTKLRNDFKDKFGSGAPSKHIPQEMMYLDLDSQKYLLRGLFHGDGCYSNRTKEKKGNTFIYSTISRQLAYQVRELLLRRDIPCSIVIQKRSGRQDIHHVKTNHHKMFDILDIENIRNTNETKGRFLKIKDNYLLMKIREVRDNDYSGPVYDLCVDTANEKGGSQKPHSFVTTCFVAHNCEG